MRLIVLVVCDVRSAHNVGSLLRTAEGLGVAKVFLAGYTPYPEVQDDSRLPHLRRRISSRIHKTALGAEKYLDWEHIEDIAAVAKKLKEEAYLLAALEQTTESVELDKFTSKAPKIALFVGNEVGGLDNEVLRLMDFHLQIPMRGRKESFNVAVAAAMALYHLRYMDKNAAKV